MHYIATVSMPGLSASNTFRVLIEANTKADAKDRLEYEGFEVFKLELASCTPKLSQ